MTNEEAEKILFYHRSTGNLSPMLNEALDLAISALSKQCASIEQADKSVIIDFVAFQRERLERISFDERTKNTIDGFIRITGKAFIDSLNQTSQNDEGRIAINLKKRTITERLIIAESLIDSVIADSGNDQFREDTKKIPDGPDTNVGSIRFKPGDKFILELGQERKMFGEFEIAGTDLYVETSLLEKLKRYEPEVKTEKIPYKKPEIIYCKDCQYRDPEDKKCDHGHGIVWQLPRPDDWFCADGKA